MFHKLSRLLRFCVFFPVVFLPEPLRRMAGDFCMTAGQAAVHAARNHTNIVFTAGIIITCVIIRLIQSVSLFAYQEDDQAVFLARLPIFNGRETSVRIPAAAVRKMQTNRVFLQMSPLMTHFYRSKKIIVKSGTWQITVTAGEVMHFCIPVNQQG